MGKKFRTVLRGNGHNQCDMCSFLGILKLCSFLGVRGRLTSCTGFTLSTSFKQSCHHIYRDKNDGWWDGIAVGWGASGGNFDGGGC